MFDRELYKEIWQAIVANKTRSILTAFGVFWGLFMLITLYGAGKGLQNGIEAEYSENAKNTTILRTSRTTIPYGGFRRNRWWNFKNSDVEALNKQYPDLYVVPRILPWSTTGVHLSKNAISRCPTLHCFIPEVLLERNCLQE